jgi:two-component sensor histidine kinase
MTTFPSVHVRLPSDARAARAARQSLRTLEDYVSEETIEDLGLLVTELVSNCVRHAALAEEQRIDVDAEPAGRVIRVEVRNPGRAELTNELHRPEGTGWGLFIVTKVASRWGVSMDGTTSIWFEIELNDGHAMIA